jgi:Nif-specific regulatory protein
VHLTPGALERLDAHDWPGNIRELGNLIERVVLLADRTAVDEAVLRRFMPGGPVPGSSAQPAPSDTAPAPLTPAPSAPLVRDYQRADSHDARQLADTLAQHGGNQSRAAQSLGLTLRQFAYRLKKAGLR